MIVIDYSVVLPMVYSTGIARRSIMRTPLCMWEWEWIPPMVVAYQEAEAETQRQGTPARTDGEAVAAVKGE